MDDQFDLIAVGGGIAGLVAALAAAEAGKRVVVLERKPEDRYTNATRLCGGVFHCALRDPRTAPDELARRIEKASGGAAGPARVRSLADNALRGVRWLEVRGIKFMRTSANSHQAFVLSPPNVMRRGLDWEGRGGDVLMRTLEKHLSAHNGAVLRGFEVQSLVMDADRCIGVRGTGPGGGFEWLARNVLIADGGFQSDPDLVGREIATAPEKLLQRNGQSGLGFGLRMAQDVGAQISSLKGFYGHIQSRGAIDTPQLWPYPWWDDVAMQSIVVDGSGHRFCDERRGGIFIANRLAELPDPQSAFVVFDTAIWNGAGRKGQIAANPNFVRAGASIHWAQTLQDLAAKAKIEGAALVASVAEFNASGPKVPIAASPFFAAPLCPGITYTMGGIVTDSSSRVLDTSNTVIPGLYAAGSTTGGMEGGYDARYIGGLIKSLVSALLAGEHVSGKVHRSNTSPSPT